MRKFLAAIIAGTLLASSLVTGTQAADGPTLSAIKARGHLKCGVGDGLAGFSLPDNTGEWKGFDIDFCRATAAAIFGDPAKVEYTPTSDQNRFTVLQAGEVDLLSRNTTVTLQRDTALGFNFAPVNFYDGDAFMVAKSLGVTSALELKSVTVCVRQGTSSERNLAIYSTANNLDMQVLVIGSLAELANTFFANRCDAWTSDSSQLAAVRASGAPNPDDYLILPEVYSKSPLAPVVRHGDDQWYDIVKWIVFATFQAEEYGMTSRNLAEFEKSSDPDIRKFLGIAPGVGKDLGLPDTWARDVVSKVGSYAEIFERNLGEGTSFKMKRGQNAQWKDGGLLYANPF